MPRRAAGRRLAARPRSPRAARPRTRVPPGAPRRAAAAWAPRSGPRRRRRTARRPRTSRRRRRALRPCSLRCFAHSFSPSGSARRRRSPASPAMSGGCPGLESHREPVIAARRPGRAEALPPRLLVFPSRILPVLGVAVLTTVFLTLVARPVAVYTSLLRSRFSLREQTLVGWAGLRGAVPIVLASFPLVAGVSGGDTLFNIVFFVVLASTLVQGTTIPTVARWLRVDGPAFDVGAAGPRWPAGRPARRSRRSDAPPLRQLRRGPRQHTPAPRRRRALPRRHPRCSSSRRAAS